MFKLSALCFASLVALHAPAAFAQDAARPASEQALASSIDAVIAPYYKADAPGATVIVTQDGKTVLRKAYGMADVSKGKAMTPDTALRLGSITKQFTAVAILMLADEGKLALDDDITKFLPDYPTRGKRITIEHLLTHTSGIVSYTSKAGFDSNATKDMSVSGMIDTFKNDALSFEPGTRWAYNNSGYFLLGAVIEKIVGQSYATFIAERIFTPLGMQHTAYEGHERTPGPRAVGHTKGWFGVTASKPLSMSQPYAAGALVSTVDDLARWDAAISEGKLLQPATWQKAHTSYALADGKPSNYGYGWQVGKLRGVPMVAHDGGINGFSTSALRLPQQKVYVAVLSNTDAPTVQPDMVASKAAAIAIGNPFPELKAVKIDNALLDAYAGTYRIDATATRSFKRDGDKLVMQRTNRDPVILTPYANDGFFMPASLTTFVFARNDKGEVSHVMVHSQGSEMINQRVGAP
ncbi:serine hydrolase [Massilia pseudoviolaceinigra]|uniref:serine hydrolase n=1 Tax=Massilia pseudoviolaceinigra TaxID=3057165 RepID=UPI0027968AB8|nr:serine hydrolase [Massilia sp. CCM 9206]MDQ1920812.1 serine hydrolase [Massilia sp. CCM 9206]